MFESCSGDRCGHIINRNSYRCMCINSCTIIVNVNHISTQGSINNCRVFETY